MLGTMHLMLLACKQPPPHELHAQALALPAVEAAQLCPKIATLELRADCTWRVVEELAAEDPERATALCMELPGTFGHECWFLLAENGDEPSACANAGPMADDCRMHLVGRRLMTTQGDFDDDSDAEQVFILVGLSLRDDRPWSAWYRMLLDRQPLLDRAECAWVEDPWRRDICENSAIPLLHDRLNRARDQGLALCAELPKTAAYAPDAVLDAELARRRMEDLCP